MVTWTLGHSFLSLTLSRSLAVVTVEFQRLPVKQECFKASLCPLERFACRFTYTIGVALWFCCLHCLAGAEFLWKRKWRFRTFPPRVYWIESRRASFGTEKLMQLMQRHKSNRKTNLRNFRPKEMFGGFHPRPDHLVPCSRAPRFTAQVRAAMRGGVEESLVAWEMSHGAKWLSSDIPRFFGGDVVERAGFAELGRHKMKGG